MRPLPNTHNYARLEPVQPTYKVGVYTGPCYSRPWSSVCLCSTTNYVYVCYIVKLEATLCNWEVCCNYIPSRHYSIEDILKSCRRVGIGTVTHCDLCVGQLPVLDAEPSRGYSGILADQKHSGVPIVRPNIPWLREIEIVVPQELCKTLSRAVVACDYIGVPSRHAPHGDSPS